MTITVSVIAPGAMGAAIGGRLVRHGATVQTLLEGRGPDSAARAEHFGLRPAAIGAIAEADFVLSVLPPANAVELAESLVPLLAESTADPVYADCNAVSPQTAQRVAAIIGPTGRRFVDAGIVGGPPGGDGPGPRIYASGEHAHLLQPLIGLGLDIRVMDGPVGAASAMKLSYAGITKGCTAIGSALALAARRHGTFEALVAELRHSQPALSAWLAGVIGRMPAKAYRFAGEMEEIAEFAGDDAAMAEAFTGLAALYARIGEDEAADGAETAALNRFVESLKQSA